MKLHLLTVAKAKWAELSAVAVLLVLFTSLSACGDEAKVSGLAREASAAPPNILLILLDDMGVNDVGAYGGGAGVTPHIDRFAQQGLRYTRHYTDSTCTATRVALLSGQDPASMGFRPAAAGIPAEIETLPEQLREAGYTSHHIGKWHAGFNTRQAWPNAQGFDSFFGFLNQFLLRGPHTETELITGRPTYHNPWLQHDMAAPKQYEGHLSYLLNAAVLDFLEQHAKDDSPWFLNYWTYAPHRPLQPTEEYLSRHPATAEGRYLALLEEIDALVGRVLQALDDLNLADKTLVLIASDNGGTAKEYPSNAPFRGGKATFFEGGVRTPLFVRWPGQLEAGLEDDRVLSVQDYLPTLLAVAKGQPGDAAAGNFLAANDDANTVSRPLFWEASNSVFHSWSVLDETGRWRLYRDYENNMHLTDLAAAAGGKEVALAEQSSLVAELTQAYSRWHREQHAPSLPFVADMESSRGQGQFAGYDVLRTPGVEGWSFALALQPEGRSTSIGPQIIAAQEPHWRLQRQAGQLELNMQGLELVAAEPPPEQCTEIVIATQFTQAYSAPAFKSGLVELFYDGVKVASASTDTPRLPPQDFSQPTTLGRDASGGQLFQGQLGPARFWNERLVADEHADVYLQNSVASGQGELCQALVERGGDGGLR